MKTVKDTARTGLLLGALLGFSVAASAGEIVRWVDADGVVHFGDRQAAPAQGAETITVRNTNGMDVPQAPVRLPHNASQVVKLDRGNLENKKGWRGYDSRVRRNHTVRTGR